MDETSERSTLGCCPDCRVSIPEYQLLIRYESNGGGVKTFAECPHCSGIVHPE